MMKPTSKKMGRPTRNAAANMAHEACSIPNFSSSQSARARPPPEYSRKRPIIAPNPSTSAESEGVAEARLDGFQYLVRRHAGGQAHRHRGNQEGDEGMQLHGENQEKEKE